MKRKTRAFRPEAAILETKVLLSVASPTSAEVSVVSVRGASASPNTIHGRYAAGEDMRAADAPLNVKLGGVGRVQGLGRVRSSGAIRLGGFRMADLPDIDGTITLVNPRGSVTLKISGYGGYQQLSGEPFVTTASVTKGTGSFASYRRIGTATFDFGASTNPTSRASGAMTLKLDLKPPVR